MLLALFLANLHFEIGQFDWIFANSALVVAGHGANTVYDIVA